MSGHTSTDASTLEVVEAVRRDGVGIWPGFAPPALLENLRSDADRLLTGPHAIQFPKSTRVWDLYRHGNSFLAVLTDTHLSTVIASLLGEHHLLSDYSLNVVQPRQPLDDWHLDYPYNEMPRLVAGGLLGVQCVLTLDRFTVANGATCYVPGSHQPPTPPPRDQDHPHTVLEAEPGTLLIMAASTWHRSGYNATGQPRAAILLSFVERWVRPLGDPPEPGPWSETDQLRLLLGMQRPPDTLNGVSLGESPSGT